MFKELSYNKAKNKLLKTYRGKFEHHLYLLLISELERRYKHEPCEAINIASSIAFNVTNGLIDSDVDERGFIIPAKGEKEK